MSDVATLTPDPWVVFMERAMKDPAFDTNKLGALLEMRHREMEQQRIERAEERKRIFSEALTAFQGEVDPIVRDAINPFLKNKYATLIKTVDTAQPHMKKHGLHVRYVSGDAPAGWLKMGIVVGHDCGYEDEPFWISCQTTDTGSKGGKLPMTPSQTVAATMTYLRRQLYTNALNLVAGEIDDDGEALRRDRSPSLLREKAWEVWIDKLQAALAPLASVAAVDELAGRNTIVKATQMAPLWASEEASRLFAEARLRCESYAKTETEGEAEEIPWEEPKPPATDGDNPA